MEMWIWRRGMRISETVKLTNEEVLRRVGEDRSKSNGRTDERGWDPADD